MGVCKVKNALVKDNQIFDIVDIGETFEVHSDLQWVEVADDTTRSDTFVDGAVVKYVKPIPTWVGIRYERNILLSEIDWRFRSDLNPSQDWIDYSQTLRDIPQDFENPEDIIWPTKPDE
jgi:hypothetical protein